MKTLIFVSFLAILVSCGKENSSPDCVDFIEMEELDGRKPFLSIGDSISIGYLNPLKENLPDFQVIHNKCNAKSSFYGVEKIHSWVNHSSSWEVCSINHGIWDIVQNSSIEDYLKNLEFEINVLKTKCKKILFVNTTTFLGKTTQDLYNEKASELMQTLNVPVCDLNSVSKTIAHTMVDHVHYNSEGSKILADKISECVENL